MGEESSTTSISFAKTQPPNMDVISSHIRTMLERMRKKTEEQGGFGVGFNKLPSRVKATYDTENDVTTAIITLEVGNYNNTCALHFEIGTEEITQSGKIIWYTPQNRSCEHDDFYYSEPNGKATIPLNMSDIDQEVPAAFEQFLSRVQERFLIPKNEPSPREEMPTQHTLEN